MGPSRKKLVDEQVAVVECYYAMVITVFRDMPQWIEALPDHRRKPDYLVVYIVWGVILGTLAGFRSGRLLEQTFRSCEPQVADNIDRFVGTPGPGKIPCCETVNRYLGDVPYEAFDALLAKFFRSLLVAKRLDICRDPLSNGIMLAADGTGLSTFANDRGHCIYREHGDGSVTYHHYALVMSAASADGVVIPLHIETVENPEGHRHSFDKQDCEYKALISAMIKVKAQFKMLPVTLLLDALYIRYPILNLCREFGWKVCFAYKEGVVKGLDREVKKRQKKELYTVRSRLLENGCTEKSTMRAFEISYRFGQAGHKENTPLMVTYAEMTVEVFDKEDRKQEKETRVIRRITTLKLGTPAQLTSFFEKVAGTRWKIENQVFNEMKNLGFNFEHAFATRGNAMHNRQCLMLIALIFRQLVEKTNLVQLYLKHQAGVTQETPSIRKSLGSIFAIINAILIALVSRAIKTDIDASQWRIRWLSG